MEALIYVGVSKETIQKVRAAILDILERTEGRNDQVTIEALHGFQELCQVKNITISGCTLTTNDNGKEKL